MIILNILDPDADEIEEKKEIIKPKEITWEDLRKLPQTALQIISIDGTIITE